MQVVPGTVIKNKPYINTRALQQQLPVWIVLTGSCGASRYRHGNASNRNRTRVSALHRQSIALPVTLLRYSTGANLCCLCWVQWFLLLLLLLLLLLFLLFTLIISFSLVNGYCSIISTAFNWNALGYCSQAARSPLSSPDWTIPPLLHHSDRSTAHTGIRTSVAASLRRFRY